MNRLFLSFPDRGSGFQPIIYGKQKLSHKKV
jgi:hypothetical protein